MIPVANQELKPAPAFLTKLYSMVDLSTEGNILWTPDGMAFVVPHPSMFARKTLPLWYAHSKFSSFVRQLNMYGFHKIHIRNQAIGDESATFHHKYFCQNQHYLLPFIKRKKPTVNHGYIEETFDTKTTTVAADRLDMSFYPFKSSERGRLPLSITAPDLHSLARNKLDLTTNSLPSLPITKPLRVIFSDTRRMNSDSVLTSDIIRRPHPTPALYLCPQPISQPYFVAGAAAWPALDDNVSYAREEAQQAVIYDGTSISNLSASSTSCGCFACQNYTTKHAATSYDVPGHPYMPFGPPGAK